MNNDERHSDTEYVEDYRPSSEELSLLRGDAGLEKGSRQPVNHSDSPSEPESALQISEIEKARMDLMLASLEAAANDLDPDQTHDTTPLIPIENPVDTTIAENTAAPSEQFIPPYRPPHAISRSENKMVADIIGQIVRDDITRYRKMLKL